eukprot:3355968-Prymnesium_polylepis.1
MHAACPRCLCRLCALHFQLPRMVSTHTPLWILLERDTLGSTAARRMVVHHAPPRSDASTA